MGLRHLSDQFYELATLCFRETNCENNNNEDEYVISNGTSFHKPEDDYLEQLRSLRAKDKNYKIYHKGALTQNIRREVIFSTSAFGRNFRRFFQ